MELVTETSRGGFPTRVPWKGRTSRWSKEGLKGESRNRKGRETEASAAGRSGSKEVKKRPKPRGDDASGARMIQTMVRGDGANGHRQSKKETKDE